MKHLIIILSAALALTACRSSKDLAQTGNTTPGKAGTHTAAGKAAQQEAAKFGRRIEANHQKANTLTAKLNVSVNAAGRNMSLGGTLRMKRDEVVQLSLTFLGIEAARLEFTPKDVLLVDRVNKQYVRAAYSQVKFLSQAQLDFRALQSLFWAEVFAPGADGPDYSRFSMAGAGDHTLLTLADAPDLEYAFLIQTARALLDRVTVEPKDAQAATRFTWRYGDYTQLGGRPFPASMKCEVKSADKEAGLTLTLSRLNNADGWETHTTLSGKYTRRAADDLLRNLLKP